MAWIDPGQLTAWFEAHGAALTLYARQWLEAGLAEDVVQECFLRLLRQPRPPKNVRAWLFRCVRNGAVNQLRKRRRRRSREDRAAAARPEWFVPRPDDLLDARTAQAALAELPRAEREAVVLRIWGGLTFAEMAELTGEPLSTVFSRYRAALAAMRRRMEQPCQTKKD